MSGFGLDYDEREVELDNLSAKEDVVNSAVDRIMEDNIDSDKE